MTNIENKNEKSNDIDNIIKPDLFTLSPVIIPDENLIIKNYWGKKVKNPKILVKVNGEPVLTAGGILNFKSLPKSGKTSEIEAGIATYLNREAIPMGITFQLFGRTKILFIDTEQSEYESQRSYERIMRRCKFDLSQSEPPEETKKLIHLNFKRIVPDDMIAKLTEVFIANPDIGLIIIDLITDLADDPVMESKDALKIIRFLKRINEDIGIITSIHVNESKNLHKPSRGHLGRGIERMATATLVLTILSDGTLQIEIDSNRIGKDRKHKDFEPVYCKWDNKFGMFVKVDYKPENVDLKEKSINEINEIFMNKSEQTTKNLKTIFFKLHTGTKVDNFNYHIKKWKEMGLIEKVNRGVWRNNNM